MTTPPVEPDEAMQQAIRLVLAALPTDRQATPAEVDSAVDLVIAMQQLRKTPIDGTVLRKEIEARVAVWQDDSVGLYDDADHIEWLADARAERSWEFWDRYRRYLEDVRTLPPLVVRRLDQSTDRILRRIEDPKRPGRWRRTGLVVGQVQSGKTGNYIGLACKAADAGYKLIVILAGIHNSLRSQTQLRVDEGLLGFDTQYQLRSDEEKRNSRIGVGAMSGARRLKVASLTTSAETGDFQRKVALHTGLPIGDYPVVLVIKKHHSILEYVRKWVVEVEGQEDADGGPPKVRDVPLLVIDDEADHASIDVSRDADSDPSAINRGIRNLLAAFDKAAYVGYTATPFANIYINPDADHDKYGIDLFPSSFIENLPAPSNYFGPERVFGLRADDPDDTSIDARPVFRPVDDSTTWMPKHKKDWVPPDQLPGSLQEAVDAFVLTCAARRARGQVREHNSMLIHVTRFTDVQKIVRDQVHEHLSLSRDRLRDSRTDQSRRLLARMEELWKRDFVPTTDAFTADEAPRLSWEQVAAEIPAAIRRIEVNAINGTSKDALAYYENRRTGLNVIAIGGDKLSRGLTLEGLSVSYYLRTSNTYDTLLQMGRWFGFRPGYEDLCRLYTTVDLRDAYAEITAADNELRRDFEEMAIVDQTPETFGLRVRSSSLGLAVTAANKMRRGEKVRISYSGEIPETTAFSLRESAVRQNFANLERFVTRLDQIGTGTEDKGSVVWTNVSPTDVIEGFLDGYAPERGSYRVRPVFLSGYIKQCAAKGELSRWTVRLVGVSNAPPRKIGTREVGLVKRAAKEDGKLVERYAIRRVLSPADETTDLTDEQKAAALPATIKASQAAAARKNRTPVVPTLPTGRPLREARRPDQPLLLIYPLNHPDKSTCPDKSPIVGFAISFPVSNHPTETEYVVNTVWLKRELDDLFDSDEPDPEP
ncbi:Z1 domain-containing protein [Virgisporangium ochraceum]|uniref:Endonuclease n=1 Tax=Virgisporangium ochraceum TaxID=65505 RepID=A0A8J3ZPG8_9ACTN|nr:Z1 domain-containing protein [Virgisporangium ochraceum]GIJ67984.1 endonuclease [Virgisporangium ochraceum]